MSKKRRVQWRLGRFGNKCYYLQNIPDVRLRTNHDYVVFQRFSRVTWSGAQHPAIEQDYTFLPKSSYLRDAVKARLRHDDATSADALQQPAISASG